MTENSILTKAGNIKYGSAEYSHYIAIDWSQKNVALARCTAKRSEPKVMEWPESDLKAVKAYLSQLTGSILLTIEETTTSHWLYVELRELVERIVICDPYRNRLLSEGPKTDKIDARKLCQLLRSGLLKEVFHGCDELYDMRQLVSAYEDLIKAGVRIQNQRSALYRSKGYRYTKRSAPELKERLDNKDYCNFIVAWQDKVIEDYNKDKACFEKVIEGIVKSNPIMSNLTRLPGVGPLSAFKIYALVVQPERFKSKGRYLSYCGLVRHEKTSGGKSYGQRYPRCNRKLKAIYQNSARVAIRGGHNPAYEYYSSLLEKGLMATQATLMVARYLAKVSLGMMKNGQKYDAYRWRKDDTIAA